MINLDFIGLFILITGFVIGLGAVTVIDFLGFLGRKSNYWTEATTRAHKVTKPLIWVGITLAVIGGIVFFRNVPFDGTVLYLLIVAVVLVVNGLFLSFKVSPYLLKREENGQAGEILPASWQRKIMMSLIFSDFGWWSALAVIVYYLVAK